MSDEGTIVQKQGEIIAVLPQKSGFTEIQIQEEGRQYPYKARTKIEAIIASAQSALFQEGTVLTAKEVDSGTPNPHRPGENYINRTTMKVEAGGTLDPAVASASGQATSPGKTRPNQGATDRSIERQVIIKEMVQHYPAIATISVDAWWGLMGELDGFMVDGVPQAAPPISKQGLMADDIPFS